jgi:hypothetical protein
LKRFSPKALTAEDTLWLDCTDRESHENYGAGASRLCLHVHAALNAAINYGVKTLRLIAENP